MSDFPQRELSPKETPQASQEDIQTNKWIAIVAYIVFFVPLLAAKDSRYALYHANQGLLLLLTTIAANVVLGLIPLIGVWLIPLANLGLLALIVVGVLHAAYGLMRPLPVIGTFLTIIRPQ